VTVGKFLVFDEKKVAFPNIVSTLSQEEKGREEESEKGRERKGEAEVYAKLLPFSPSPML